MASALFVVLSVCHTVLQVRDLRSNGSRVDSFCLEWPGFSYGDTDPTARFSLDTFG